MRNIHKLFLIQKKIVWGLCSEIFENSSKILFWHCIKDENLLTRSWSPELISAPPLSKASTHETWLGVTDTTAQKSGVAKRCLSKQFGLAPCLSKHSTPARLPEQQAKCRQDLPSESTYFHFFVHRSRSVACRNFCQ